MRAIRTTFANVQGHESIAPWASFIDAETPCIEATCKYGDVISTHTGFHKNLRVESPLGFILSGKAELCESSNLGGTVAYRPIRILGQGDVFGDFLVLDTLLGLTGPARRNERWELVAGAKSVHIIGACKPHDDLTDEEGEYTPFLFLNKHNESIQTRLLILSSVNLVTYSEKQGTNRKCGNDFFNALIAYSWGRAKIYRDSLNSFNYGDLLDFRRMALGLSILKTGGKTRRKYTDGVAKGSLQNIFIDALYDALNRPFRDEPVFAAHHENLSANCLTAIGKLVPLDRFLLATKVDTDRFYFPIDASNFFINYFGQTIAADVKKAFGGLRGPKTKAAKALSESGVEKCAEGKKNARTFYRDFANEILNSHCENHYPYKVECLDVETYGTGRRGLVLCFDKVSKKR